MDDPDSISTFVLLFMLLVLSAVFSGTETALLRLKARQATGASPGKSTSRHLAFLLHDAGGVVSTLLLSNTAVNVAFATVFTGLLISRYGHALARHSVEILSTLLSTALILFWGEVLPKTAASRRPESVAGLLAVPVYYLNRVVGPIASVFNTLARRVLAAMGWRHLGAGFAVTPATVEVAVELGMEQGTLEKDESSMILGALDTPETKVREIMTPRPDVMALDAGATVADVIDASKATGYSRIPVYDGTVDNIIGVVYVKDLLRFAGARELERQVKDLLRVPLFVHETRLVPELLREMRGSTHLAVVVDEYGGTAGIVTLEDAVEEIVGEIADEFDKSEAVAAKCDRGYILPARTRIQDVNDDLGLDLPLLEDVDSIGGLVYSLADRIPHAGETVSAGNWVLTVVETKGSRLMKVRVERAPSLTMVERRVGTAGAEAR